MYEIKDFAHDPGHVFYVNADTQDLVDCWVSGPVPLSLFEQSQFKDITPAKQFKTKSEAQPYLDALKSARLLDWDQNSHYYKARGLRKPQWRIYAVETPTF